jgi:DNA replication protein DnaC
MKTRRQADFVKLFRAVDAVKETYAKGHPKTKAQVVWELVEPELLILDEAGMQRGTDEEKNIIGLSSTIIARCYHGPLQTLPTGFDRTAGNIQHR